jgi:hypothetical protein
MIWLLARPAAPTVFARLHLMQRAAFHRQGRGDRQGSINQRAVLKHREAMVDALHAGSCLSPSNPMVMNP